jgi:cobalt-zinc-cadmium efflux system membrane fusion protein
MYAASTDAADNAYTLRAPMDGVVVEKNVNVGQEIRPDQMLAGVERIAAPLFTVTDPTKLWLLLDVTEADAAQIDVGQKLQVRAAADPAHVYPAVLEYESDALDSVTRTVKARALVDNGARQLKAEQLVTVEMESPVASTVLSVPNSAVFLKGDRHFVFAESGSRTFVRREVKIGASHEGQIQITTGLEDGDRVVTDGVMLLEQVWENASTDPASNKQAASL